jgi:hypothetical protein
MSHFNNKWIYCLDGFNSTGCAQTAKLDTKALTS